MTKDTSSIKLSPKETVSVSNGSSNSSVEVNIKWKAEPPEFISDSDRTVQGGTVPAGTVTPHETEIKKVTLTATAKKGNAESSKTIEVTVYPKNNEPNLQTVVESIVNGIPTEIDADIQLPQSPSGYELTWSSSNDSILKIAGNSGHIETWDLVDRMVELTATLKKNATGEQATKPKTLTIKARKKFTRKANIYGNGGTYEFDGNKLTLRHGDDEPTAVYRVSIDTVAKTITATLERLTYGDNSLMEPEEVAKLVLAEKEIMPNLWFSIFELQQKDLVTLKDIRAIHQQFLPPREVGTEENIFSKLPTGMSYEDFLKKTPEEQSKLIKQALKAMQNGIYKEMNWAETLPLTEAKAKFKLFLTESITARLKRAKKAYVYQYRIEGEALHINAQYISNTLWYRQPGKYSFYAKDSEITEVSLSGKEDLGSEFVNIAICEKAPGSKKHFFAGYYDGSSTFKAKRSAPGTPEEEITVNISGENKDAHTLSVQISGAISFTGDLTFSGRTIPSSRFDWFQL